MPYLSKRLAAACTASLLFLPYVVQAAPFSYAVWIPYWKEKQGVDEIRQTIAKFGEISPFSFEVRSDGSLTDRLQLKKEPWPAFLQEAIARKASIIPTIAWTDGEAIHRTLASSTARTAQVRAIGKLVKENDFAGIDIDYENKKADTRILFSQFLKELSENLHKQKKILSCSIEARTPLSSRFSKIPKDIEYANDYPSINKYCDKVRILAYDQGIGDIKLNASKGADMLYTPVADPDWVRKVIIETTKSIKASKISLGIPTFGYEYEFTKRSRGYTYRRIQSVTYRKALDLARVADTLIIRNRAGELSFAYASASSTRLVWFPDAQSAQTAVRLAKQYGLAGVVFFKADGETDPALWTSLR